MQIEAVVLTSNHKLEDCLSLKTKDNFLMPDPKDYAALKRRFTCIVEATNPTFGLKYIEDAEGAMVLNPNYVKFTGNVLYEGDPTYKKEPVRFALTRACEKRDAKSVENPAMERFFE